MKGKRGQVFLLAAVILVLALFSVSMKYNTAREYPLLTEYKELTENYLTEAPKIINYAKYENKEPTELLQQFTYTYVETAKKRDPNFGIFYTYRDNKGIIHIINTLNNRVLKIKISDQDGNLLNEITSYGVVESVGSTCIAGFGCTTSRTTADEFGNQFSTQVSIDLTKTEAEEQKLKVCVSGDQDCTEYFEGALNILTNTEVPIEPIAPQRTSDRKTVEFTIEEYK